MAAPRGKKRAIKAKKTFTTTAARKKRPPKPKTLPGRAPPAKLRKAAALGTAMHAHIEAYIKGGCNDAIVPRTTKAGKMARSLIAYAEQTLNLELWKSEVHIPSPAKTDTRRFIDCLARVRSGPNKGELRILDWKSRSTTSAVHKATFNAPTPEHIPGTNLCANDKNKYQLQLAEYSMAIKDKHELKGFPRGHILVCTLDLAVHDYPLEDWALDPTRNYVRRKTHATLEKKRKMKATKDSFATLLRFINQERPQDLDQLKTSKFWLGLGVSKIHAKNMPVKRAGKLGHNVRLHTVAETRFGVCTSVFNYTQRMYDAGSAGGLVKVGRLHMAALQKVADGNSTAVLFVHKNGVWKARENDLVQVA